jgi:hypothetical protein
VRLVEVLTVRALAFIEIGNGIEAHSQKSIARRSSAWTNGLSKFRSGWWE